MPPRSKLNFKRDTLLAHRQQTKGLLAEIAGSESWFYTGTTDRYQAKHLCDFIGDVTHENWLLFTECHWTRDRAHKMFATLIGQDYGGCLIESITHRHVVEDEVINVPDARWMRVRQVLDDDTLFVDLLVKPVDQWLECADICILQNGVRKTIHLLMFGLSPYQAIVLMGVHRIFPNWVVGHPAVG